MTVYMAKSAGFCGGVARAVNTALKEAGDKKLVTIGMLVNNRILTDELAEKGVGIVSDVDEIQAGETAVIRSHGVPASVEEELKRRGIPYIDCTCVDVKKIRQRAARAKEQGRALIVLGDRKHPEVKGYAGPDAIVINNEADIDNAEFNPEVKYTLVAQTTFERGRFFNIAVILKNKIADLEIHNTICDATARRQAEAAELSARVDVMIVLGDALSANTRHLYEICRKSCPRTYMVPSIREMQLRNLRANDKIGITAGASTPPSITKEAIRFMNEIAQDTVQSPQTFEEMLNEAFVSLHTGDVVKSTVISVTPTEVTVNLGYKSDGIITKAEMTEDASADITQMVKPGDTLDVYVLHVNDGEGNVLVSKKRLDAQTHYKLIEQAFNDKTPISGKVTEVVKGGLIAVIHGCRVFVPSSQVSNRFVEDLNQFKGREFDFHILEFDRPKRRIVAGRKELAAIEQQQRREELFASLESGQRVEGTVSRIVDFGAFVDLGGVDGLIHISELSWQRVKKVSDILQAGDSVSVTVIDINPEKNKISLSLKDINSNPWNGIAERFPVGNIVEGKVVRMASFGAFVTLEDGVDGLVHISQIARRHIVKPDEELSVGQVISVKVTDVDEQNHKISLSKRDADEEMGIWGEPEEAADGEAAKEEDIAEEAVIEEIAADGDAEAAAEEAATEETVPEEAVAEEADDEAVIDEIINDEDTEDGSEEEV